MKKYRFYLWLIALAGLITSCSQDEADTLTAGESNRVSFTASLPADFAQPGTRALPTPPNDYAGNSYKLRCILEVWSKDLSTLIVRKEASALSSSCSGTVHVIPLTYVPLAL